MESSAQPGHSSGRLTAPLSGIHVERHTKRWAMDIEERIHFYRLLDSTYGALESSERIREELIRARQRSLSNRVLVILLTLSTALPALYGILPDEIGQAKTVYLAVIAGAGFLFAIMAVFQWWEGRQEAREANDLLHVQSEQFLQMQISSYLTRWIMASGIVGGKPDEPTLTNFTNIQRDWEERLSNRLEYVEAMWKNKRISDGAYLQLRTWLLRFAPRSQAATESEEQG